MLPEAVDNAQAAGTGSGSQSGVVSTGLSHGTASESLIKAAQASVSSTESATGAGQPAGDTGAAAGAAGSGGIVPPTTGASGQPPQTGLSAPAAGAARGEAPENRIQAAVRNARQSMLTELGLPADTDLRTVGRDIQSALKLLGRLRDPEQARAFFQEGLKRVGAGAAEDADEQYPDADLVSQDGKVKTFSHEAHLKALQVHGKNVERAILKKLQPYLNEIEGMHGERQTLADTNRANELRGRVLTFARTLPHFKENEAVTLQKMQEMDPRMRQDLGPVGAMCLAYTKVLADNVIPNLKASLEKTIREEYAKSAHASSGQINPNGSGAERKSVELKGTEDLARHMEKLSQTMVGA